MISVTAHPGLLKFRAAQDTQYSTRIQYILRHPLQGNSKGLREKALKLIWNQYFSVLKHDSLGRLTMNWATALMKKTRSCSVSTSGGISVWGSYLWKEAHVDSDKKYMGNIKETGSFVRQKNQTKQACMRLENKSLAPTADWGIQTLECIQRVCVQTAKAVEPETLLQKELLQRGPEYIFSVSFAKEQNLAGSIKSVKYLFSEVIYYLNHKLLI